MKKRFNGERSLSSAIAAGIVSSILSVVVFSLVATALLSKSENPTALTGLLSTLIMALSGAACGVFVAKFKGSGGTLAALLSALSVSALVLISKLVFSSLSAYAIINSACFLSSAALCSYIAKPKRRKRRY